MGKEVIVIGCISIFIGILILVLSENIILPLILIILGIIIIPFYKEEEKIERRKDQNQND